MSFRVLITDLAKRQIRILPLTPTGMTGVVVLGRTLSTSTGQSLVSGFARNWKSVNSKFGVFRDRVRSSKTANYVVKLQTEAFWQQHRQMVLAAALLFSSYCLWSCIKSVWLWLNNNNNNNSSQSNVSIRSLTLTLVVMLGVYGYIKRRFGVDPDAVYRVALVQMNTHPGLLEIIGAPINGSQLRAMVVSGGGLKMKGWSLYFQSRRVKMTFPIMGSYREGVAFLDVKKIQGKYMTKVLGVDVRLPDDQEQRVFLKGDSSAYSKGGVLASLQDSLLKSQQVLALDAHEDVLDEAELRKQKANMKEEQRLKQLERSPKRLDQGGGMYLYERVYWWIRERAKVATFAKRLRLQSQEQT